MKTIIKTKSNIKYIITLLVVSLAFVSCYPDEIEFEVKDSFEVGVNVFSNAFPNGSSLISATATVNVSNVIEGKNIKNLEITGVSLKLNNDFKSRVSKTGSFTPGDMLPAHIDANLVLAGSSKQLFKGNKNLMNEVAQDLELTTPISFKELLGADNVVKVSIRATFPSVYLESANFTLDMVLKVRAITGGD
jgi:hypothetical protein